MNYTEARRCAWQERLAQRADLGQNEQEPLAWYVGGSLILADIYFNGTGVQRNSPLAMRFACEAEEGMATLALPDIRKRQVLRRPSKPFEFCEYAVTTFSMNFCAAYDDAIDDDRRDRYYKSLKTSMAPNQRAAFDRLLADELAYVQAHTGEVYQGGTIRGLRTIGSQDILKNLFHTQIVHFERRKWPKISETRIAAADDLLGREYKKAQQRALAQTSEMIDDGAVTADQLSAAQKSWSAYRDAWIAFAGLRYPDAVRLIRAEITLDRCRLLKTI